MPSNALDPGHFYQTSTDIATRERRAAKLKKNRAGHPISLSSRVLALCRDARNGDVYAALSGGEARKVNVGEGTVGPAFRPPSISSGLVHPLTSLALVPAEAIGAGEDNESLLLGGSWSAKIYMWNVATRKLLFVHDGAHADFVKTLLLFPLPLLGTGPVSSAAAASATPEKQHQQRTSRILLASAAADTRIALWDVPSGASLAGERDPAHCLLGKLTGHARPVLALAADPAPTDPRDAVLFSGSSDGEVRRWRVRASESDQAQDTKVRASAVTTTELPFDEPLRPHPSSIYGLVFAPSGDLWTAGADGTARCLARPESEGDGDSGNVSQKSTAAGKPWTEDTSLVHGATNAVRALALSPDGRFVVTGCRDEDVWVWDAASGDLLGKFAGHADEVVALLVDDRPMPSKEVSGKEKNRKTWRIVSGALDSTVRCWDVGELSLKEERKVDGEREGEGGGGEKEDLQKEKDEGQRGKTEEAERGKDVKKQVQLTEEEERELAELMDDDDE